MLIAYLEATLVSLPEPVFSDVEIAEQHIHCKAADGEPSASVHDGSPRTQLRHLAGISQRAHNVRVQGPNASPVVHANIPVAVRPSRAGGSRAAEHNSDNSPNIGEIGAQPGNFIGQNRHENED
jgi:hypothetical protein